MGVLCQIRKKETLRGFLRQHAGASRIARNCLVLAMTRKPYLQYLMPASTTTKRTFSLAAAGLYRVRSTIGEDCSTTPSNSSRVCARSSSNRTNLHAPLHPPSPSLCTFIIIPPAAIVKPQGFLARGFPPRRAAGVHSHLTLSHASHHPTNLSDSPPAGMDTCCLSPLEQETPSEPPRWSVLPSPPPAASPRCWVLLDVSSDVRVGVPPRCCRRGGTWALGLHNHPPPHSIPPHTNPPRTPYHTNTHSLSPLLTNPGPLTRGQAQLDRGIIPTSSDTIDQTLPP